jgi:cell division septation protein DedD
MAATKKKPAPKRPKRAVLGRFAVLGLVAVWMFALGVLVGRGSAPLRFDVDALQKQLAELKKAVTDRENRRFKVNLDSLKFFQNLKDADETAGPFVGAAPGAKGTTPHKAPQFTKPEQPASVVRGPAPEAPAAPLPGPPGAKVEYILQVASSRNKAATGQLVAKLKKQGFPAFSAVTQVPGKGTWYRIRVGPYIDRTVAERARGLLKAKKFDPYIIER